MGRVVVVGRPAEVPVVAVVDVAPVSGPQQGASFPGCAPNRAVPVSGAPAPPRWWPEVLVARKDELGKRGEECAAAFLADAGYRVLARNWRCAQGEIDLVAERDGEVVFVEVKTRSSTSFGHPFEAITVAKLARLRRLAAAWCDQTDARPGRIRIDAIAVIAGSGAEPVIEHLEGVF